MTIRKLILGSAGAAALIFATGAFAQQYPPSNYYNTNPTPSEVQQTQQLNSQADQSANAQAQQDNDAQGQYNGQMQQYQDQQNQYRQSRRSYDHQRAAYSRARIDYHMQRAAFSANRSWYADHNYAHFIGYPEYPDRDLQPVYLISEPSQQLHRATVVDRAGYQIGSVRNVEISPDGRPWRIQIALSPDRFVWVHASDARFDPYEDTLYTSLYGPRLWQRAEVYPS